MRGIFLRKGSRALMNTATAAREIMETGTMETGGGVQSLRRAGFVGALAVALGTAFAKEAPAAEVSAVQELRDRAEIANLISALTFADDRHDADAFAGAFVPDGLLDIVDPKAPVHAKGREAIAQFARGPAGPGAPAGGPPGGPAGMPRGPMNGIRHINFNNYIQIVDRTHARHLGYWMSVRNAAAPRDATDLKLLGIVGQDMKILGCGIFDDDLVKVDGRWYFQVHRLRFDTVKPD